MKEIVSTKKAPAAIGPYSQAVCAGGFMFTSGQLGIDPESGNFENGVAAQTRRSLSNLAALIAEQGACVNDVVKTTVFLKDMNDFAEMNGVYAEFFEGGAFPARSAVEVARLPKDGLVEIEAVVRLK